MSADPSKINKYVLKTPDLTNEKETEDWCRALVELVKNRQREADERREQDR